MNRVILRGFVGQDPEYRTIGETSVIKFSLATSERYKDKNNEYQTKTEWHKCTAWGGLANFLEKALKKGSNVLVEGKIQYSNYEKNGEKMYSTDIKVESCEVLDKREEGASSKYSKEPDDLPF